RSWASRSTDGSGWLSAAMTILLRSPPTVCRGDPRVDEVPGTGSGPSSLSGGTGAGQPVGARLTRRRMRMTGTELAFEVVPVDKPADTNVIIGQAHFIKTVDDLHEALVGVSPHLRFGIAFCEASGARLVRHSG